MLRRIFALGLIPIVLASGAKADDLALAQKGKKQTEAQVVPGANRLAFDGNTLTFHPPTAPSQSSEPMKVTVSDWAVEIRLVTQLSPPDKLGPVYTNYPNLSSVKEPSFGASVASVTKDVLLQKAQLEQAQHQAASTGAANIGDYQHGTSALLTPPFPTMKAGDLTSCKGRGRDWIVKTSDVYQAHVSGKVLSIADGWLSFQAESSQIVQKYRLSTEIASLGLGTCP